jgi:hypothetical protein
MIRVSEA